MSAVERSSAQTKPHEPAPTTDGKAKTSSPTVVEHKKRNVVQLREVPDHVTEKMIVDLLESGKCPKHVSLRKEFGGNWFAEFETEDAATDACFQLRECTLEGKPVAARIKSGLAQAVPPPPEAAAPPTQQRYVPGMYYAGIGYYAGSMGPMGGMVYGGYEGAGFEGGSFGAGGAPAEEHGADGSAGGSSSNARRGNRKGGEHNRGSTGGKKRRNKKKKGGNGTSVPESSPSIDLEADSSAFPPLPGAFSNGAGSDGALAQPGLEAGFSGEHRAYSRDALLAIMKKVKLSDRPEDMPSDCSAVRKTPNSSIESERSGAITENHIELGEQDSQLGVGRRRADSGANDNWARRVAATKEERRSSRSGNQKNRDRSASHAGDSGTSKSASGKGKPSAKGKAGGKGKADAGDSSPAPQHGQRRSAKGERRSRRSGKSQGSGNKTPNRAPTYAEMLRAKTESERKAKESQEKTSSDAGKDGASA